MIEATINRDKALAQLSDFEARLYFMVLPHTDNFGRAEGDAELVKALYMPLSTRPVRKFDEAIGNICDAKLWTRYKKTNSRLVIQYNEESFDRINKFLIRNRDNPEYPAFEDGDECVGRTILPKPDAQKPDTVKEEKKAYFGTLVMLTEVEYKRLIEERGEVFIRECIEFLDLWFKEKEERYGKYSSHNAMMRRWVMSAVDERRQKRGQGWSFNSAQRKKEACPYCGGLFPNIEVHKNNCPKAPPPASAEAVKKIMEDVGNLANKFDVKGK